MNFSPTLKEKLMHYGRKDIIITGHAEEQAIFRGVSINEVMENIINPERLVFADKQQARHADEEKYDCYFSYSNTQCHRYVLVINARCAVCTIIKINRRWQRLVEKHAKI